MENALSRVLRIISLHAAAIKRAIPEKISSRTGDAVLEDKISHNVTP